MIEFVQQIQAILPSPLPFKQVPPEAVMRAKEGELRYALDDRGNIISLNF